MDYSHLTFLAVNCWSAYSLTDDNQEDKEDYQQDYQKKQEKTRKKYKMYWNLEKRENA